MPRFSLSEITRNELKALTLGVLDTLVVTALLACVFRNQVYIRQALTSSELRSYAFTGSLPLACLFGRVFHGVVHDRLAKMMYVAAAMSLFAAFLTNAMLLDGKADHFVQTLLVVWAPTSLLVVVYEWWSRPAPPIPVAIIPAP